MEYMDVAINSKILKWFWVWVLFEEKLKHLGLNEYGKYQKKLTLTLIIKGITIVLTLVTIISEICHIWVSWVKNYKMLITKYICKENKIKFFVENPSIINQKALFK